MRSQGYPIFYVAEISNLGGASSTSTVVNFNNAGTVRSLTMAAVTTAGVNMPLENFKLNIYRQNRDGMMTNAAIASCVASQPGSGASAFVLPPMMGEFRVSNLDQLVVQVENLTASTTAVTINVVFWLNVEG